MSGRRIVAGAVAALLLPASATLLTTTAHSADTAAAKSSVTSEPLARKAKKKNKKIKRVVINEVLPGVAHQGRKPASSNAAKGIVAVTVKPKKRNQKVVVQFSTGGGWKKAGQAKTDKRGRALVPVRSFSSAVQYRAKAGGKTSSAASTEAFATPSFVDEFSGRSLSANWTHRVQDYNPAGFRSCSRGNPKAVQVKGGTARLSVMKDPARKDKCVAKRNGKSAGKVAYRINGHISTENSFRFTYGYAAARIKFPRLRGQHGSFWMQPAVAQEGDLNPRIVGAEIDVIEYFGQGAAQGGLTSFTYHWDGNKRRVKTGSWIKNQKAFLAGKKDDWWKNYHVFSVKWTPKSYTMYIDGKQSWHSTKGVSGAPQFPILSLLSSDYEIKQLKGGDKKLPVHMNVDWMKVWETPAG